MSPHECYWCGDQSAPLRMESPGMGWREDQFSCEACFTGQDDGPCWDELGPVVNAQEGEAA